MYDMCSAGHRVVFDMPLHGADLSRAENKGRTETTTLKLRNRVWESEVKMIPKAETESRSHVGSSRGPGWAQVESHLAQAGLVLCGLSVWGFRWHGNVVAFFSNAEDSVSVQSS